MRRSDREIISKRTIEEFISEEQIIRIAFYDDGDIYIVPVNYGYVYKNDKYMFYFHGAKTGRKYELSKSEPVVGFEIDGKYKLLEKEAACNYSAAFQSVIGTGKIQLVYDIEEKRLGLNALMKQTTQRTEWSYDDKMLNAVAVFRLDVYKMSCKEH
ncbi:MAG: pyridoxamine 5'-phosphate oxidase family protein [Monoglobaceae bacterium]